MKRTSEHTTRWAVLAALTSSCCQPPATVSHEPGPRRQEPADFAPRAATAVRGELWPDPAPKLYVPPDDPQARAMAALTRALFASPSPRPADLEGLAAAAGYQVEGWEIGGRRFLAARERSERRGGGGAILVRADPPPGPAVLLQAPHAFHDLGTERIALDLMLGSGDGWPRALFVNTIHRYLDVDGTRRKRDDAPADPCHNPGHLLAVATAAALEVLPDAEVLQLHGFDELDVAEGAAPPIAIVSAGERTPSPRARAVAEALRVVTGQRVALFGDDIDRLGATTNVQGLAVRARGGAARFVHIELSAALRQQLRSDPAALQRLALALQDARPTAP